MISRKFNLFIDSIMAIVFFIAAVKSDPSFERGLFCFILLFWTIMFVWNLDKLIEEYERSSKLSSIPMIPIVENIKLEGATVSSTINNHKVVVRNKEVFINGVSRGKILGDNVSIRSDGKKTIINNVEYL
jgi:hypothetical protein